MSGLALAGLVAGGAGVALQRGVMRAPRTALLVLDPRAFSVLAAVADTFCPGGDGLPSAWDLQVPEAIDSFLATSHPGVGVELTQALMFVENGLSGLILDGRARPFSTRDAADRLVSLERFATSRIPLRRTVYKALLGLVSATYWGDARTFAASGYRPPDFTGFVPRPPETP